MPIVSDFRGILAYHDRPSAIWNYDHSLGTPVIVTYNFTSGSDLELLEYNDRYYPEASYSAFNEAQQQNFRDAAAQLSQASGIIFVEVDGPAMINIANGSNTGSGGFAYYPRPGLNSTNVTFGALIVDGDGNYDPGSYQFGTLLHELGHAVGLSHPHDGRFILADAVDNPDNTVMTYNTTSDFSERNELGSFDIEALQHLYGDSVNTQGWVIRADADEFFVRGTSRDEAFFAVFQETRIKAGEGNDTLIGRGFDDVLVGEAGDDRLRGNGGDDVIKGNTGDDRAWGGRGNDVFWGGRGEDALIGELGDDRLYGGKGADSLVGGQGEDRIVGGSQADTLEGGRGDDLVFGGRGFDEIYGGTNDDRLYGGRRADSVFGGSGSDTLFGGIGDDLLDGGARSDRLYGGSGNDMLDGAEGRDQLFGGDGDDILISGGGSNGLNGGQGADQFIIEIPQPHANFFEATYIDDYEQGVDVLEFRGGAGVDYDIVDTLNGAAIRFFADPQDVGVTNPRAFEYVLIQNVSADELDTSLFVFS